MAASALTFAFGTDEVTVNVRAARRGVVQADKSIKPVMLIPVGNAPVVDGLKQVPYPQALVAP